MLLLPIGVLRSVNLKSGLLAAQLTSQGKEVQLLDTITEPKALWIITNTLTDRVVEKPAGLPVEEIFRSR